MGLKLILHGVVLADADVGGLRGADNLAGGAVVGPEFELVGFVAHHTLSAPQKVLPVRGVAGRAVLGLVEGRDVQGLPASEGDLEDVAVGADGGVLRGVGGEGEVL
jgi:hypothetical protein